MDFKEYQGKAHQTAVYPGMVNLVISNLQESGIIKKFEASLDTDNNQTFRHIDANPYYPALGLAGEVGEFCNKLKKVQRDNNGVITDEFRQFAKDELGDVLWYVAECASSLDLDLDEIAERNIEKLFSRKERGKLQGEGDNR